ncbi:GNAT family N-acetyltransferase [Nocardioides terrigena]|uniref:GNAT family N-acetyltransferase n=1 Tax=Nocardioides terrigena TaxID=424797 RepID=UPI000D319D04|nr:N-acetyltransferase [Nocardioides terrigena]
MVMTHRPVTADDADVVAALMSRIAADHATGFELSASEVRELLADYPGVAVEGRWDGEDLVAYTAILPRAPHDGSQHFLLFGDVDPARLGEGHGTAMLGRAIEAARAMHAVAAPSTRLRLQTRALAGREDQARLLSEHGLGVDRHNFLMFSDLTALPEPVLPDDLVVGTFDPETAEELRDAHNEAFRDYPNGTAVDQETWQGFMVGAAHTRHDQSFVLRDPAAGGRVAAYVFVHEYELAPSGAQGREAYVAYVGTLPAHRGRGLATHLLAHTLHACRAAGFDTSSLDVDTQNPTGALGIYERAGYGVRYRQDNYALEEEPVA